MRLTSLVLSALLAAGCSKGGLDPNADGGGGDGGGGDDLAMGAACTCPAGEGCLRVTVTRNAADAQQPWVVWPTMADGVGTLVVGARAAAAVRARQTVPMTDVKPKEFRAVVDLGCVSAGALTVTAFLDDNQNAQATDVSSSDYLDSCMLDRQPMFTVTTGQTTAPGLALNQSCD